MKIVSYKGAQPQVIPPEHANKSEAHLLELGFVVCPDKPQSVPGQVVYWANNSWLIREPNESELDIQWQHIRNEATRRLAETDYIVIKAYELSLPIAENAIVYRSALRDIYNNVNNLNPFDVTWPIL